MCRTSCVRRVKRCNPLSLMIPELESQLYKLYPQVFPPRSEAQGATAFQRYGFTGIGGGWIDVLREMGRKLDDLGGIVVEEVKQKFGLLRVHVSGPVEKMNLARTITAEAATKSERVCEDCGAQGKQCAPHGYVRTMCEGCLSAWVRNLPR